MNLCEVMVSALVFAVAASGSLRVWALSSAAVALSAREERLLVRIDADLERSEARLARLAAGQGPLSDCGHALEAMAAELAAAGEEPELGRRLNREGAGWQLSYAPGNGEQRRQRQLDPVAFGLCAAQP